MVSTLHRKGSLSSAIYEFFTKTGWRMLALSPRPEPRMIKTPRTRALSLLEAPKVAVVGWAARAPFASSKKNEGAVRAQFGPLPRFYSGVPAPDPEFEPLYRRRSQKELSASKVGKIVPCPRETLSS